MLYGLADTFSQGVSRIFSKTLTNVLMAILRRRYTIRERMKLHTYNNSSRERKSWKKKMWAKATKKSTLSRTQHPQMG